VTGIASTARLIDFQRDPREEIWEDLAPFLYGVSAGGQDVLIAPFRPKETDKTKGGVYLVDTTIREYDYQGVAGLILAMGPYAYKTEKTERWFVDPSSVRDGYLGDPKTPQIGDWVVFNLRPSIPVVLGPRTVRFVDCQHILTPIASPDMVM
jgi:hypothetical protein